MMGASSKVHVITVFALSISVEFAFCSHELVMTCSSNLEWYCVFDLLVCIRQILGCLAMPFFLVLAGSFVSSPPFQNFSDLVFCHIPTSYGKAKSFLSKFCSASIAYRSHFILPSIACGSWLRRIRYSRSAWSFPRTVCVSWACDAHESSASKMRSWGAEASKPRVR